MLFLLSSSCHPLCSLGPLLRRVGSGRVEEVVDVLVAKLTSAAKPKDSASRELGALGLKQLAAQKQQQGARRNR